MSYIPRLPLRKHQLTALELTRGKKVFAYLCEMGTGKSAMVIAEWGERVEAGTCDDLLVVAPAGSYLNWCVDKSDEQPSQLRAHLPPAMFSRTLIGVWESGAGVGARKRLEHVLQARNKPRFLAVNVEALSSTQKARQVCADFLSAPGRRSMFVVDESTVIKNDGAIRTKEVLGLRHLANMRRILTGLVTPRSPLDLFSQFEFLDLRILGYSSIY